MRPLAELVDDIESVLRSSGDIMGLQDAGMLRGVADELREEASEEVKNLKSNALDTTR